MHVKECERFTLVQATDSPQNTKTPRFLGLHKLILDLPQKSLLCAMWIPQDLPAKQEWESVHSKVLEGCGNQGLQRLGA